MRKKMRIGKEEEAGQVKRERRGTTSQIKHLASPAGQPKNPVVRTELNKTFLGNLHQDLRDKERIYTLYDSVIFEETRDGMAKICIRVTPKHKASWVIFYKTRKNVSDRSYKLANYEDISFAKAVELAKEAREAISEGLHPEDARRQKKTAQGPTLKQCMEDKIASRGLRPYRRKGLAQSTVNTYRKHMDIVADYGLADIPMTKITSHQIRQMHDRIPEDVMRRGYKRGDGWATASKVVGLINGLYRFAHKKYETEDIPPKKVVTHNPCDPLSADKKVGGDHRTVKASERSIRQEDLEKFWTVLESLSDYIPDRHNKNVQSHIIGQAYLKFMLFTGMRGGAVSNLKFRMYRPEDKTLWIVGDDKYLMKTANEFMLPLSDEAGAIVDEMHKRHGHFSEYIFPNISGKKGAEIGVPPWVKWVRERLGIDFIAHGLRSTYITCAVSCKVPEVVYKKLVDHGNQPQDVTSGYTRSEIQIMREYTQNITDFILYNAGVKKEIKEPSFTADENPFNINERMHGELVSLANKQELSVKDIYEQCLRIGILAHKMPNMTAQQLLDTVGIL